MLADNRGALYPYGMHCLLAFNITATLLLCLSGAFAQAQGVRAVPANVKQLIVATGASWDTHRGSLQLFERKSARAAWERVIFPKPIPVLFGKSGMAWGRGALPIPKGASRAVFKKEGDRRTPAGCFQLGRVFGYAPGMPAGSRYPYKQVTKWDAWIDDVQHPLYNQHFYLANPERGIPPWFEKERMRLGDFAYAWKLEVRHNSDPPAAGAGSAIFFHIRRGENRATAGCTTMTEPNLLKILQWLHADAAPHYVVLPDIEYRRLQAPWKLPKLK
ncbi:MAG: hypothetical protein ACI9R3_002003 [Verrucomicrobiales bacterium]